MSAIKRYAVIAAASFALAACSDDSAPASEEQEENLGPRGEVLGGTISDDMLPLDTVTSQSPSLADESTDSASDETSAASEPETPVEASSPAEPSEDDAEPAE